MRVTQLRLGGQGSWPDLRIDRFAPELSVLFGPPRSGKSTIAQLAAHLLYGKTTSGWRRLFAQTTRLAEGSVELESPHGKYLLRRHRDGTSQGRLSIASISGTAVDSRTIRSLLSDLSPQLLAALYAVDFAESPRAEVLLDGEFAREFTQALSPGGASEENGIICQTHAPDFAPRVDRPRVDELVRRRDAVIREIEQQMQARRRESGVLERELREVDATLTDRRQQAERLQVKLRAAEAKLAEIDATLRYFSLETAVRRGPAIDPDKQREAIERLDAEISRCRQTLSDLQSRDAAVRRELAEVHPDGTADSADCLADQRATVGVFERLLDDLDAEVAQLARAHEPGRCVGCDSHARLSPVVQMLRQQLYTLCGQVTEQERTVRRVQLQAESRQLARAQTDLSEQLEHLLKRRQSVVHEAQIAQRPVVTLPQPPAASHCQCEGHTEFVREADAMLLARGDRGRREEATRSRRLEQDRERNHLRAACDALQQEIEVLEGRWQRLQRDRAQAGDRPSLDELRSELSRLEGEIRRAIDGASPAAISTAAAHRHPWKASDVLAQLTDGRFVQIRTSRGDATATIIDREGRSLALAALTPAQHDQLYLALTLALVSSLASRGVDLPLFLDEPFLRQDASAAAAMAGVLDEFARQGRQVIVVTENREAARRFEGLGVEIRNIDDLRRSEAAARAPAPLSVVAASETPQPAPTTVRLVRETVGERIPQLRVAGDWRTSENEQEMHFLTTDASTADFPVLGNDTAAAFASLGIHTIGELLAAEAKSVATALKRANVSAETVRLWQTHMALMCFVPGVTLNDAQVLAANQVSSIETLLGSDVRLLAQSIERFLNTERGRRFAPLRERYSLTRLLELQRSARSVRPPQESAAQLNRDRRVPRPRQVTGLPSVKSSKKPMVARVASAKPRSPRKPLRFFLDRSRLVTEAPSIGRLAAERLAKVGIRTVADLLNANPDSTAEEVGESRFTPAVIRRWQVESRLACRIPELRNRGARLLVACGLMEPEQVAGASAAELATKMRAVCRTARGRRILRRGKAPSRRRIAEWIRHAAQMRPLEAA
jgi:uncharacterized protein YhaN